MKTFKTLLLAVTLIAVAPLTAQTADEILSNYFENTGGEAAWNALEGAKMIGSVSAQGMDIPVEMYQMKDGKQLLKINIQGQEMTQFSFDGDIMWTTNFMTMLPEKSDTETTENMKINNQDFPSPFLNYKEKGYTVEYLGKETKEGTETFNSWVDAFAAAADSECNFQVSLSGAPFKYPYRHVDWLLAGVCLQDVKEDFS